ncbi:UNVERIFIED_CONTAM: hypothetical protein HDU68_012216 [Siphonaria sp. JEL0065]|nr:hypothetical protein HDU68_012216 [Siphonaria sp. JEL0065]
MTNSSADTTPKDLTAHVLQPLLSQIESDFEVVQSVADDVAQSHSSLWTTKSQAQSPSSSSHSATSEDSFKQLKSRQTQSSHIWSSISSALRETETDLDESANTWKREDKIRFSVERDDNSNVDIGSAVIPTDDSMSERVTAELVEVPMPATLFASKWSYDWDLSSNGLVVVQSEGFYCGRSVVRMFDGLVHEVEGVFANDNNGYGISDGSYYQSGCERRERSQREGGVVGALRDWLFGSPVEDNFDVRAMHQQKKKRLEKLVTGKLEDALDEMDQMLGTLETHVFEMIERSSIVHAVWQGANGIAERERRKVLVVAEELRDELEALKQKRNESGEWVLRRLSEWIFLNSSWSSSGNEKEDVVKINERALRRLQRDMELLVQVVQSLQDMAPGIVQIGSRVKQMRAGVQRFRADLKASTLMFGGDVSQQVERMRAVVGRLSDAVGTYRG